MADSLFPGQSDYRHSTWNFVGWSYYARAHRLVWGPAEQAERVEWVEAIEWVDGWFGYGKRRQWLERSWVFLSLDRV